MDTLDKYLIKELLIYFLLVLFGISALAVGVDFLSKFWSSQTPFIQAMEIYLYKIPKALQQFVPVASLMATLLVLSSLGRSNELLALYAGGISSVRVASTFIAVIATVSTIAFVFFDPLLPVFEKKRAKVEGGEVADPLPSETKADNRYGFWYRSKGLVYHVGAYYPQTESLGDIEIFKMGDEFQVLEKIKAQSAQYEEGVWTLRKGLRVFYPDSEPFPVSEAFDEMKGVITEKPGDFQAPKVEESTMRLRDLRHFIEKSSQYGVDTTLQKISYHERVAHVFSPLIFVLLGLAFSLSPLKNKSSAKGVALSFLLVFIYLILSKMSLSIGKGGRIPPAIAAWVPNMLFLSFTGFKLIRGT